MTKQGAVDVDDTDEDDDFGELRDARVTRMDGVAKAANGTSFFFAKSAEGSLLPADLVRQLLGEADTASPMVKAAYEALVKQKYSAEDRRRMAADGQALPDGSYPIADGEDLDNAIHAVGRGNVPHDAIRRHIMRRAKALGNAAAIPDSWGAKGSVKKADGDTEPGSPAWEAADAAAAQAAITALTGVHEKVKELAAREATEVGAGHLDDVGDVMDLTGACEALACALSTLAAFAAREQLEAGDMAKADQATPDPGRTVHDTMAALAQAHDCPACQGFLAAAKAHDSAPQPPVDATDGPAAAPNQGTAPANPMEHAMTDATGAETTQTAPAAQQAGDDKQSKKAKKLAKSAAMEALAEQLAPITTLLTTQNELLAKQQGQIDELAKGLEAVSAQPVPSGLMMNGAVPSAGQPAPVHRGDPNAQAPSGESAELAQMRKAAEDETDPRRKKGLQQQALLKGLHDTFSGRPTVRA